jgi:hypothetical protein
MTAAKSKRPFERTARTAAACSRSCDDFLRSCEDCSRSSDDLELFAHDPICEYSQEIIASLRLRTLALLFPPLQVRTLNRVLRSTRRSMPLHAREGQSWASATVLHPRQGPWRLASRARNV